MGGRGRRQRGPNLGPLLVEETEPLARAGALTGVRPAGTARRRSRQRMEQRPTRAIAARGARRFGKKTQAAPAVA